ncbi:MAG TPA: saccharopine dehydrogenase C-terminal domain-containing protein, partial [Devosiaceae bacterium]|nr:saccharopine dehydrogenase C-terminal domain-containing protein [Devosiaceae bacterium]
HAAVTAENYRDLLTPLLTEGAGQGFCVNLSVDTSSLDLMVLSRQLGALYIDTVVEPWLGYYFDASLPAAARTNYFLRETVRAEKRRSPGGPTSVSCCGANPGMVSWFVKQALLDLAGELGLGASAPARREDWAALMARTGVTVIHIAERDTQRVDRLKPPEAFWNTWSVEGFLSEGFQPAELGWGTHERWMPDNARGHAAGGQAAIYLLQAGGDTRVRTWCPTPGPQYGFLVPHNEAISIAEYFTVGDPAAPSFRPTCHYAYHPCNAAVLSLHELFGRAGRVHEVLHVLDETEIHDGADELGVLLCGHARNAYWYGSQLSIEAARALAPFNNATGLQVTSAVMAGMVWALENPKAGIVETDEMDFERCLAVQRPYLGPVGGFYTDWTPLSGRPGLFPEDIDPTDPWQFRNVLVR